MPVLQLGDTGGIGVYSDNRGHVKFEIFELIRGQKVERASCVVTMSKAKELIKVLCTTCGVPFEEKRLE